MSGAACRPVTVFYFPELLTIISPPETLLLGPCLGSEINVGNDGNDGRLAWTCHHWQYPDPDANPVSLILPVLVKVRKIFWWRWGWMRCFVLVLMKTQSPFFFLDKPGFLRLPNSSQPL
jgi:hypothetical protein